MDQTSDGQLEQIIKSAEKAIKYGLGDPETALLHARRAAEAVCKDVYENKFQRQPKRLTLNNLIGELSQEDIFPRKVMYSLRVIQNFGGTSAHPNENIDECLEPALEFFSVIIKWYFEDYKKSDIPNRINFRKKMKDRQPFTSLNDPEPVVPLSKIDFSPRLSRAYCLFGFETDGGRESELWNNPLKFHEFISQRGNDFYKRYDSWAQTKRQFSFGEIVNSKWVKVADHGYHFHVNYHADKTFTERPIFSFNEEDYKRGTWELIDGVLRMKIEIYELDIFGDRNGLHSGIEDIDGDRNAYF